VPGHEAIGRIDALGSGVEPWRVGQRVGIGFLGGHCGICSRCRRGDFVNCERQPVSGVHTDGGYAEVMIAKANALAAIPDELSPVEAAPLLCAGLTTFNALRKSNARAGDLVAIQGVADWGIWDFSMPGTWASRSPRSRVARKKRDLALKLGAHYYIDSSTQNPAAELQRLGGARVILATAANNKSMSAIVGGLAPQGEMIVAGAGGGDLWLSMPFLSSSRALDRRHPHRPLDRQRRTLAFSALQGIRAMVEPCHSPRLRRPTGDDEQRARFRIVLVTGQ